MKIALMSFIFLFVVSCSHFTGGCNKHQGDHKNCPYVKDGEVSKCKDGKCPYVKKDGKPCENCTKADCPKCKEGKCPMKKDEATPASEGKKTSSCIKCMGPIV